MLQILMSALPIHTIVQILMVFVKILRVLSAVIVTKDTRKLNQFVLVWLVIAVKSYI